MKLSRRQKKHRTYLKSDEWAKLRADILIDVGFACERCGKKKGLQVHHLTYERFGGDELREDLIVLCSYHHRLEHGLIKKKKKARVRNKKLKPMNKKTVLQLRNMGVKKLRRYLAGHRMNRAILKELGIKKKING